MNEEVRSESLDILDGIEHDELSSFLANEEWLNVDISNNWLDTTQDYKPPQYTLRIGDVPFAPIGGIHALTGQPGNGKTMTIVQLIAALLGNKSNGIEYNLEGDEDPVVLYIDTEQEQENTMLVYLRVCALLGWDFKTVHPNFKILWLREEISAKDRWKKTLKALYEVRPTAVFLDGIIDVIQDFNDNKECQKIIFQCMALASRYHCSSWLLLHLNPGTEKMVGHAGSYLQRKATDIFQTIKDKSESTGTVTFKLSQKKARGKDVPDYKFRVNDDQFSFGIPQCIKQQDAPSEDSEFEKLEKLMREIVIPPKSYSKTEVRDAVKKTMRCSSQRATDMTNKALEFGIIKYQVNNKIGYVGASSENKSEEEKLPF